MNEGFSMFLNLLGALGVFLFGLRHMSEALQKAAGDRLRELLAKATGNRFKATFTGFLVTCAVQSSSAATVMFVGFASAGLLNLYQCLGLTFGANIGTTTTAWIVSLLGFKVKMTAYALPIIGVGFFAGFIRRWRWPRQTGDVMVGFGLLFLGLAMIKQSIPDVKHDPWVMEWIASWQATGFLTRLPIIGVGTLLTMVFQSSSAMMAVTLTAAAEGLIDYPTAAALVLGENIGTTLTANLAAIGAPLTARRAARGHAIFNVFGAVWAAVLFVPFLRFVDVLVPGDPFATSELAKTVAIPIHLSMFHTMFNVVNTGIFLVLIRPLETLVRWIEPDRGKKKTTLIYLQTALAHTPELAISAAEKEVDRMAGIVLRQVDAVRDALSAPQKERERLLDKVIKDEKTTDALEHEIHGFLAKLTHEHLSRGTNKKALSLMSMSNDLERMGDHGEKLATLIRRTDADGLPLPDESLDDLRKMADQTYEMVAEMKKAILQKHENALPDTLHRETELNKSRNAYKDAQISRVATKKTPAVQGIIVSDMLTSFEKMGDHAVNVVEAVVGVK